jgi:hypothetical protein
MNKGKVYVVIVLRYNRKRKKSEICPEKDGIIRKKDRNT